MVYRKLRDLYDSLKRPVNNLHSLAIVRYQQNSQNHNSADTPIPEKDELETVLHGIMDGLEEVGKTETRKLRKHLSASRTVSS